MFGRRRPGSTHVVVGLGNPGSRYAATRHNAGAMLVELLSQRLGAVLKRTRGQVRAGRGRVDSTTVLLAVPSTFMNVSGPPVGRLVRSERVPLANLLVCYDELDLPLGRVRFKAGGGTAGHNGLESVCASLRARDFVRLRIGIGRPPPGEDPARFVLRPFDSDERPILERSLEKAADGVAIFVSEGLDAAQRAVHAAE